MVLYLFGRLTGIVVVFIIVSVLAFVLMHSVPGGPFDEEKAPLPPAAKANILKKYGLDKPLYEQYLRYMGSAVQGDFGTSFQSPTESVTQLIARAWPTSMQLGGLAIVLAFIIGLTSGILAAVHQNTWIDYLVTFVSALGITVPNFVIALWLLLVFAVGLGWLPTGGWPSGGDSDWRTLIMPVITLALGPSALVARYTRSSLVEVLHAEYVRTARAKGLREHAVVLRHALKNALIPLITILGPQIPNLITGTIFVEVIFRVPGLGKFFVSSIYLRDYPMIMATMLLVATLWSFTYLASDLLYTVVDPRVRLFGEGYVSAVSVGGVVSPRVEPSLRAPSTLWRDAVRRFRRNKLAVGALAVMLLLIVAAVFADQLAPARYDFSVLSEANQFPSRAHLAGTDGVGRDFLSRLIVGARVSLTVGLSVQAIALLIGLTLGTLAGSFGSWVDYIVMRLVEVFTAVPVWLFALFLISVWRGLDAFSGNGLINVIMAIGLISWIDVCRLTRAQLLSLREKEFVMASHALGAGRLHIAVRHMLPNALAPLIVAVTLGVPTAIFTEAGLSFLGFGINDPLPSWGKMVADSLGYVRVYWYLGLFPTLVLALTMLSFSFVGDGLRDALDPQLGKR